MPRSSSPADKFTVSHFGSQLRDEEGPGARGLIAVLIYNYTVIFHTAHGILTSSPFELDSYKEVVQAVIIPRIWCIYCVQLTLCRKVN